MITDFVNFICAFRFWLQNPLEDHVQSMLVSHASETMASLTQSQSITAHTFYALTYIKLALHQSYFTCGLMFRGIHVQYCDLTKNTYQQYTFAPSRLRWNALLRNGCDWTESEHDYRIASISILAITPMSISRTRPEHHGMPLCVSVIAEWVRKWDTCFVDVPLVFEEQVNAFCLDRPPHRFI